MFPLPTLTSVHLNALFPELQLCHLVFPLPTLTSVHLNALFLELQLCHLVLYPLYTHTICLQCSGISVLLPSLTFPPTHRIVDSFNSSALA